MTTSKNQVINLFQDLPGEVDCTSRINSFISDIIEGFYLESWKMRGLQKVFRVVVELLMDGPQKVRIWKHRNLELYHRKYGRVQ